MSMLIFAQDVDKAIDWAAKASQLGVAGICLFIMFLAIAVAFWVMQKNTKQSAEIARLNALIADKEKNFRSELVVSKDDIVLLERSFRGDQEKILREMFERGEDSGEVLSGNTQALKDMTHGMQQLTARIELVERRLGLED